MSSLYDRVSTADGGPRALSAARLRYEALKMLHRALSESGMTQVELAKRLGIRKSAVNQVFRGDGNVRMSTLAEYLHEMGQEAILDIAVLGTRRAEAAQEMSRHCEVAEPPAAASLTSVDHDTSNGQQASPSHRRPEPD
jgi:transcriptional regulator with XRE-family HTH domain